MEKNAKFTVNHLVLNNISTKKTVSTFHNTVITFPRDQALHRLLKCTLESVIFGVMTHRLIEMIDDGFAFQTDPDYWIQNKVLGN